MNSGGRLNCSDTHPPRTSGFLRVRGQQPPCSIEHTVRSRYQPSSAQRGRRGKRSIDATSTWVNQPMT